MEEECLNYKRGFVVSSRSSIAYRSTERECIFRREHFGDEKRLFRSNLYNYSRSKECV